MLRRDHVQRARIQRDHTPGPDGRCPTCRGGHDGSGPQFAPCRLWLAADEARRQLRVSAVVALESGGAGD